MMISKPGPISRFPCPHRGDALSYTRVERLKKELEVAISEGDFELALEVISDMIDIDPDNDQYWNSKGVVLAKLGRIDESVTAFDRGLEIDPGAPKIWYSKGVILMDNGNQRAGLACFYKALDLDPALEKARERFNRCLDELVLLKQADKSEETPIQEDEEEEKVIRPPDETFEPEPEGRRRAREEPPEIRAPKARKRGGTYLDDDMFSEEEKEEDEGWEEEDEEKEEEEEWEEEDEGWEEEEEEEEEFIRCRCGEKIYIRSDDRPYRFECDNCGRTGTLK